MTARGRGLSVASGSTRALRCGRPGSGPLGARRDCARHRAFRDRAGAFHPRGLPAGGRAAEFRRRFVSLVPTQLHKLLETARNEPRTGQRDSRRAPFIYRNPARRRPASADLLAAASALGLNTVTTYGSAETAGGCVYSGSRATRRAGGTRPGRGHAERAGY